LIAWLRTDPKSSVSAIGATKDPGPERGWPLRLRLLITVTAALLPVAIVSVLQGLERSRIDVANVHERLLESARAAAINEEAMLAQAQQILRAVASFPEVLHVTRGCDHALGEALVGVRPFENLSRLDADGMVLCSALPSARHRNAATFQPFVDVKKANRFTVSAKTFSPILSRPVVIAMLPLQDRRGRFAGAVSTVVDVHWLDYLLRARDLPQGAVAAIFDRAGIIIASNDLATAKVVFAHLPRAIKQETLESSTDGNGNVWSYAAAPLFDNSAYAGFAMREAHLFGPSYLQASDFAMPILMIVLAWIAIGIGTDRQVTQWILYLRRVAQAYRRGHYAVRPSLESAPKEFRMLGAAFADMAAGIQDRDRRLRDAIDQKTVLVREIHHRVKNNLQIVMSLLSLQAGQLRDPVAREALLQAQVRINALALVHRILNEIEDQSTVDLKRLIEELTHQVAGGLGGESHSFAVETDIIAREVSGDLAVPLALFTVEALTNIFKHAYPNARAAGRIRVGLRESTVGWLRLTVEDNGVGFDSGSANHNVGSRLISTFAQQLGGTTRIRSIAGAGTLVELVFPDPRHATSRVRDASAA
jgi:two-component sensor histidine kinase